MIQFKLAVYRWRSPTYRNKHNVEVKMRTIIRVMYLFSWYKPSPKPINMSALQGRYCGRITLFLPTSYGSPIHCGEAFLCCVASIANLMNPASIFDWVMSALPIACLILGLWGWRWVYGDDITGKDSIFDARQFSYNICTRTVVSYMLELMSLVIRN